MPSGEYGRCHPNNIQINRGDRIRKELTEDAILSMMSTLSRIGQIHPIVVRRDFTLVAGETRLTAAKRLGWMGIDYQFEDTLDERELLALEIEENVKRSDLSWQDQCDAVRRYHDLQLELESEWDLEKTADNLGLARRTIADYIRVAKAIEAKPELANAPKFSTARGIATRSAERAAGTERDRLLPARAEPKSSPILTANFLEWVQTYSGPSFNFINCDFPYGIGADKFNQGAGAAYGGYEDKPETYWNLVEALIENRDKLLGESGHVIFWFSMRYYAETLVRLSEHFWVDPYPLVWHKNDNKGTLPDPERGPRRVYEVAFLCSYGDRKIVSAVSNTFAAPTVRLGEHMSEKSQIMLEHFFRMTVDESTRMLDPTCGSGSALRAARTLKAASVLGLEMNPEFAEAARRAYEKA